MRVVLQRVTNASVTVAEKQVGTIDRGILVFLGIERNDLAADIPKMAEKVLQLRIFEDADGKMNRSVVDIAGGVLVISQFTLAASCNKGRRPSFDRAEMPDKAKLLYDQFIAFIKSRGVTVASGIFQAEMQVNLVNDGPATFILENSK